VCLVVGRCGWEGSAHDDEFDFVYVVSDGCELSDSVGDLAVGVESVLYSSHGCWFVACVALWGSVGWSAWAVGAGFWLWAWVGLGHYGDYGDA